MVGFSILYCDGSEDGVFDGELDGGLLGNPLSYTDGD
jgi:hypothetical protein